MYSNSYENIRMMFWNGTEKAQDGNIIQYKQYKLDQEGIKHSIWRALKDYTARTDEKKENDSSASADKMLEAIPKFIEKINEYFSNETPIQSQEEYDEWHKNICTIFINEIQKSGIRAEVKYGKAQKIVNMSMKTIYCLDGSKKKSDEGYFAFCHMPLDSITLNWFRNYVAENWFNIGKKQKERIKISLEGGPLPKWSNLSFKTPETFANYCKSTNGYNKNNPYDYMFIVTMTREYFKQAQTVNPYYGLTPFQAEFYIWVEEQYEEAARVLKKQSLLEKLQTNIGVSVNNKNISLLNEEIKKIIVDLSMFY